jgi:phosphate starvation-inducible PhoH-like protein
MILANRKLLTRNQAVFYRVLRDAASSVSSKGEMNASVVIGVGETGTGKSYVASRVGIELLMEKKMDKMVILVDRFVDNRANEMLIDHMSNAHLNLLLKEKTIEIAQFSSLKGRTFLNAYVVADDAQNTTLEQMKMLLTRVGSGCQLVITGNHKEGKWVEKRENGLANLLKRLDLAFEDSDESPFSIVNFTDEDIKRSELTKKIIKFYQQTDEWMRDGGRYV